MADKIPCGAALVTFRALWCCRGFNQEVDIVIQGVSISAAHLVLHHGATVLGNIKVGHGSTPGCATLLSQESAVEPHCIHMLQPTGLMTGTGIGSATCCAIITWTVPADG
jgi:hypothetical protein